VWLFEDADGGSVFVWGMAVSVWDGADVVGRRLAAVQLVKTRAAGQGEVAAGFGVGGVTLWRWLRAWQADGVAGLAPQAKGPRGPSKLTEAKVAEIRAARAEGLSIRAIAAQVGVAPDSVLRALGPRPAADTSAVDDREPVNDTEDVVGTESVFDTERTSTTRTSTPRTSTPRTSTPRTSTTRTSTTVPLSMLRMLTAPAWWRWPGRRFGPMNGRRPGEVSWPGRVR